MTLKAKVIYVVLGLAVVAEAAFNSQVLRIGLSIIASAVWGS
jgi:hypothetical protein